MRMSAVIVIGRLGARLDIMTLVAECASVQLTRRRRRCIAGVVCCV